MSTERQITGHYARGNLLERLYAALVEDGVDPNRPTIDALAPYDQFHGRGLEATQELCELVSVGSDEHLLDVGSGLGGPARYIAQRFGCRVTGIDLTAEFCEVAQHLTRLLALDDRVSFEQGSALAMPFAEASFDGAYSMNVSMNIADKLAFYREIGRVLKPGGWLVLSEIAKGPGPEMEYPTPWAESASASFLATPEETMLGLEDAGYTVVLMRNTVEKALAYGQKSRAIVEAGGKPPHRAVILVHADIAPKAMANSARGVKEGSIVPIEVLARKRM